VNNLPIKEVNAMQKQNIEVLAEGTCPFMGGAEYSCCYAALSPIR
jgi:hypothetical protein